MEIPQKNYKKSPQKDMNDLTLEGKALLRYIKETLWLQKEMINIKLPNAQTNINNAMADYSHAATELLEVFNVLQINDEWYKALKNGMKDSSKNALTMSLIDRFLND